MQRFGQRVLDDDLRNDVGVYVALCSQGSKPADNAVDRYVTYGKVNERLGVLLRAELDRRGLENLLPDGGRLESLIPPSFPEGPGEVFRNNPHIRR